VGMTVLIGDSKGMTEKEQEHIETFLSYRCSGTALCLISPNAELVNKLKMDHVNFVMLDAPLKKDLNCDRICIDNERDSYTAVEYLVRCGHRRIAIISPEPRTSTMQERFSGYRRALDKNSLEHAQRLVRICEGKDEVYQATLDLTSDADRPTAIYVAKQSLGLSVISACLNTGIRIPDDISIVIFGDPDWATVFRPRITCMQRQVAEMGRLSIQRLLQRMKSKKPDEFRKIVLDSRLVVRESVKEI
jgi:LacI family transcriptional regulator